MNRDATPALLGPCNLYVVRESRALICCQCRYALATANSQVTTHLDRKHGVSKELRKGLTQHLREPFAQAIPTEKHQTRFQPLQPYMDQKSIGDHTRPWQQILMFFARTQREHAWKSPAYRFTRRQREAWEALVEAAEKSAGRDEAEEEEGEEQMEVEDGEDETMADVDEAIEEMETHTNDTIGPHDGSPDLDRREALWEWPQL
jgi:hypothetical protein